MVRAVAKYIRMSPRKLRRVVNEIRGKNTIEAQNTLRFMPYAAARVIEKVLKSAVANAKENNDLNPTELKITKAFVDQSTTLRRWRAVSKGRGYLILKRTSHITIEVDQEGEKPTKSKKEKSQKTLDKHEHVHSENCDHGHDEHKKEEQTKQEVKGKKEKPAKVVKKTKSKTKDSTEKKPKKKKEDKE